MGRHEPATPVSHPFRLGLQGGVDHRLDPFRFVGGLAAPAWCDLPQARQSLRGKTIPPQTNCFAIDIHLSGDGRLRFPVAGREYNAAAEGYLLRRSQCPQPLLDLVPLILRHDQHGRWAGHEPLCSRAVQMSSYLLDTTLGASYSVEVADLGAAAAQEKLAK